LKLGGIDNEEIIIFVSGTNHGSCLAACGNSGDKDAAGNTQDESDLAYVKGKGKMIIGYTDYAPMNYTDEDGNFTGFDTEWQSWPVRSSVLSPNLLR